jgi:hypothetical protein
MKSTFINTEVPDENNDKIDDDKLRADIVEKPEKDTAES